MMSLHNTYWLYSDLGGVWSGNRTKIKKTRKTRDKTKDHKIYYDNKAYRISLENKSKVLKKINIKTNNDFSHRSEIELSEIAIKSAKSFLFASAARSNLRW